MFEVLVFVYEHFWRGEACPESAQLQRKLNAVGFEADEIQEALDWLDELNLAASGLQARSAQESDRQDDHPPGLHAKLAASPDSLRIYSVAEQSRLGQQCLGFICFLEAAGVLPGDLREIVIDRAMAAPQQTPLPLDDLKVIVLMVYWSLGKEPDALVLDELCDHSMSRLAH
jgi:Smg protein